MPSCIPHENRARPSARTAPGHSHAAGTGASRWPSQGNTASHIPGSPRPARKLGKVKAGGGHGPEQRRQSRTSSLACWPRVTQGRPASPSMETESLSPAPSLPVRRPKSCPGSGGSTAGPGPRAVWVSGTGTRGGRTYSVSESSKSDTAGTTLSTGVHAGLTQERPRWMTSCTYLGNNHVSEPQVLGQGLRQGSEVTVGPQTGRRSRGPREGPSPPNKAATV